MTYRTIDLFAGIGGIRKGFELAGGFVNVLSAEIDKHACATYQHLFQEDPFNDVTSKSFKDRVLQTEYEVLLAGFPCQSFSRAGRQEGFLDQTRGTLFFDLAEIISITRPKAFLLENVDNLISHEKGKTFRVIINTLSEELDYEILGVKRNLFSEPEYVRSSFVRNTRNFGLPQNRPRVYIMGFDRKRFGNLTCNLPIKQLPTQGSRQIYKNLRELLELKAEPQYYLAEGYWTSLKEHRKRHEEKGNGFGYRVVNDVGIENPIANALLAVGGSGIERNLIYDPQEGIAGQQVGGKRSKLNSEGIRVMTPREWGKLQGFINYAFIDSNGYDGFSFPKELSKEQQYKQFGNSVSVTVIEEMAKALKKNMDFITNV